MQPTAGDPDRRPTEFEQRVLAEYGWVRRLASTLLRSESDADDVTQEVIAAALKHRPRSEPTIGIRRWLDAVTRRQAARWHRRRHRREQIETNAHDSSRADGEPRDVVARLEQHRTLTAAVLALPEPYRSTVVARFLDERSCAQIAANNGVTEAAVRQRLHRALERLRDRLGRDPDWRRGLLLLAYGARPTLSPPLVAAAAALIMKTTWTVALAACVLLLTWQLTPRPAPLPERHEGASRTRLASSSAATDPTDATTPDTKREAIAAQRGEAGFPLRVTDHAGMPLPDVTVVLHADRTDLVPGDFELRATDVDGRVRYATPPPNPDARGWRLLLAAASRLPQRCDLELPDAGTERTVRFGGPVAIGGRVTPVGDAAALGSEVGARPPRLYPVAHLYGGGPVAIMRAFETSGIRHLLQGAVSVDATTGAFSLAGLHGAGTSLEFGLGYDAGFVLHPDLCVAEHVDRDAARLRADRSDQVLAVVPIPRVRLRVVLDDGTPAAGADVLLRPWLVGSDAPSVSCSADGDGVILLDANYDSIPVHRFLDTNEQPRIVRVSGLCVIHPAAERRDGLSLDVPTGARWVDAGEIVLRRLHEVHVTAVDAHGEPVRGAVFQATNLSGATDGRGHTVVHDRDAARRAFTIGAPGALVDRYEATSGSGTADDPLRFVLARENRVVLTLDSEELRAADVRLELTGPAQLFHSPSPRLPGLPSNLHRAAGVVDIDGSPGQLAARFAADRTLLFTSLVPGARVTATAIDLAGIEVARCTFVAPTFGESLQVSMQPDVAICRIDGRVQTSDGEPIAKAHLVVGEGRSRDGIGYRARTNTDAGGHFHLRLVATGETVTVRVTADDHEQLLHELSLTDGKQSPWLTLQRGRPLTARLVDEHGTILDAEVSIPRGYDLGIRSERQPDRSTQFRRLPASEVTLIATFAGRNFSRRIDPASVRGPVEFRAPSPERIALRVAPHVDPDAVLTLSIMSLADEDARVHTLLHCVDGTWQPTEIALYPGRYRVRCHTYASGGPRQDTTWTVGEGDHAPRWLLR